VCSLFDSLWINPVLSFPTICCTSYHFKFTRGPKGSTTKNMYFYLEFEIGNRVWNMILIGVSHRAVIFLIKLFIPKFTCPSLRVRNLYGQGSGVNGTKSCIVGLSWHLNVLRVMVFNATFNNISVICGSQFYWWMKPEYWKKSQTYHKSLRTSSHNVVLSTPRGECDLNSQL
jgi:hypothetical protein